MSQQLTASERLERMLAIVPWVAAQPGGASIPEICQRFDLDEKQLLSCLERVWMVGVYPYTPDALVDLVIDSDHVQVTMSDYFRRPLQLTSEQRLALLIARRTFASVPGADIDGPLVRALDKVAKAISLQDADPIDLRFDDADLGTLDLLRSAVSQGRRITFRYYSYGRDEHSTRTIEPWRVQLDRGHWYVEGQCLTANDSRIFRIDRISDIAATNDFFDVSTDLPPLEVFPRSGVDQSIVLELAPPARWVVTQYPVLEVTELGGGVVRVRLPVATRQWLERLLVRLGSDAIILEADGDLRHVGAEVARRLLVRYQQ